MLHERIIILMIILFTPWAKSHLVGDKTYWAELKKLCEFAYTCFHDTVAVCGTSVAEARAFLDLCDLYEYSCEYNMVYIHVPEKTEACKNRMKTLG